MPFPKSLLAPNDPRIQTLTRTVPTSKHTYSYLYSPPAPNVKPVGTILLLHGFPDLAFGWRNQILFLSGLGLNVVVPNMLGYAGTDAPKDPREYTYKNIARDLAELAELLAPGERIFLGGHDWGGAMVWRFALWYPALIRGIFAVCAPYAPPSQQPTFKHPGDILPNFGYQKHFAGKEVEDGIRTEAEVRGFLNAMYGGPVEGGVRLFDVRKGFAVDELKKVNVGPNPLLSQEEMDFYVQQYMIHSENPLGGPLNWYRLHEFNYNDEKAEGWGEAWRGKEGRRFEIPALAVVGEKDAALPPAMSEGMEGLWKNGSGKGGLRRLLVGANHWALWSHGEEINEYIGTWFKDEFGIGGEFTSPRL